MAVDRIPLLEALVSADPSDLLGHLMLGNEYLAAGRTRDAIPALAHYCERSDGDKGAACLSLAKARAGLGDLVGARDALRLGLASAAAYRHRALLEALEALEGDVARLSEAPSA